MRKSPVLQNTAIFLSGLISTPYQLVLTTPDLPLLWILSPTASVPLLNGFKATLDEDNWLPGVYFLGDSLKTALVAIHQLPRTAETLWLRILGKGTVQKQAISELAALSANHPLRANALLLLTNLQANLQTSQDLDEEDRELLHGIITTCSAMAGRCFA